MSVKCHTISPIVTAKATRYSARCSLNVTGDSTGFLMSTRGSFRGLLDCGGCWSAGRGSGQPQGAAREVLGQLRRHARARGRVEGQGAYRGGEVGHVP